MKFINNYLSETIEIISKINQRDIYNMWEILHNLKGRLFILGIGGSAANASHAVNDFRKIMNIDAHTPIDNNAEFSARINDDGWDSSFINYLKVSNFNKNDCILVLSVGGGSEKASYNIVKALEYAYSIHTKIIGIVGRDGGYTEKVANACVIVPIINKDTITPHTEELQSVILHLIVSYK